jgi:hypothetical protein
MVVKFMRSGFSSEEIFFPTKIKNEKKCFFLTVFVDRREKIE